MISTENSTNLLVQLDAINPSLSWYHSNGINLPHHFTTIPPELAILFHQRSFKSFNGKMELSPRDKSGVSNGGKLCARDLDFTYDKICRASKPGMIRNQLPESARLKANVINNDSNGPWDKYKFLHYQIEKARDAFAGVDTHVRSLLGDSFISTFMRLYRIEFYYEVPAKSSSEAYRERIGSYLNQRFKSRLRISQDSEILGEYWAVPFETLESNEPSARIKVYKKGSYFRVELSLEEMGYMASDSLDEFIAKIHTLANEGADFLEQIYNDAGRMEFAGKYSETDLKLLKKAIGKISNSPGKHNLAQEVVNQLLSDGSVRFKGNTNRTLNYLVQKLVEFKVMNKSPVQKFVAGKFKDRSLGKIYTLSDGWQKHAKRAIRAKESESSLKRNRIHSKPKPLQLSWVDNQFSKLTEIHKFTGLAAALREQKYHQRSISSPIKLTLDSYLQDIFLIRESCRHPNLSIIEGGNMNSWLIGQEFQLFSNAFINSVHTQPRSSEALQEHSEQPKAASGGAVAKPNEQLQSNTEKEKKKRGRKRKVSDEKWEQAYHRALEKQFCWDDKDHIDTLCEEFGICLRTCRYYIDRMQKKNGNKS